MLFFFPIIIHAKCKGYIIAGRTRDLYISSNLSLCTLEENLLYSKPISFFPFAQMESMCADQDKSDAMNNNINNHYSLI